MLDDREAIFEDREAMFDKREAIFDEKESMFDLEFLWVVMALGSFALLKLTSDFQRQ